MDNKDRDSEGVGADINIGKQSCEGKGAVSVNDEFDFSERYVNEAPIFAGSQSCSGKGKIINTGVVNGDLSGDKGSRDTAINIDKQTNKDKDRHIKLFETIQNQAKSAPNGELKIRVSLLEYGDAINGDPEIWKVSTLFEEGDNNVGRIAMKYGALSAWCFDDCGNSHTVYKYDFGNEITVLNEAKKECVHHIEKATQEIIKWWRDKGVTLVYDRESSFLADGLF